MRVNGTDPLTMNKIQNQNRGQEVQQTNESASDNQVKSRQEAIRGKDVPRQENKNYAEQLEEAVKQANETADTMDIGIRFKLHEKTDRIMALIINRADNEVIKEIPAEKILNLVGQIQEMIGLMMDEKR